LKVENIKINQGGKIVCSWQKQPAGRSAVYRRDIFEIRLLARGLLGVVCWQVVRNIFGDYRQLDEAFPAARTINLDIEFQGESQR
jgi:hypothetical protein